MNTLSCRKELLRRVLLTVLALASFCGCADDDGTDDSEARLQLARWADHGIADYRYQLEQGCFCDPITSSRVMITVTDHAITSVRHVLADTLVSEEYWDRFMTIEQLFEVVMRAEQEADHLAVEYDAQYAFPRLIDIYWDYSATDNGYSATVSEFEVLDGPGQRRR